MIYYQHCPVCDGLDIHELFMATDHTVSQEKFPIWHCNECTLRFTQSVPGASEIGKYYQSADYISHSDTRKGMVNNLYHLVRNITLKQKRELISKQTGLPTGRLLDLGCGTGAFLSVMKEAGWTVKGLEPDEKARGLANQKGLVVEPANKLFDVAPFSFDVITLWHVLEHVHELHPYMDQLRLVLEKKGCLFIAVPNYTSHDAGHYKESWAAYDVPRHLYHFSPQSMHALLQQHGLKAESVIPMWFDSFYVSMLSEQYRTGKGNIVSAISEGFYSNIMAMRDHTTCSSLIYCIKAV